MEKDYSKLPEYYVVNAVDLLEDLITAFKVSSDILEIEPTLIINFAIDYLNNYINPQEKTSDE